MTDDATWMAPPIIGFEKWTGPLKARMTLSNASQHRQALGWPLSHLRVADSGPYPPTQSAAGFVLLTVTSQPGPIENGAVTAPFWCTNMWKRPTSTGADAHVSAGTCFTALTRSGNSSV